MSIPRRIFISETVNSKWLTPEQRAITEHIVSKIEKAGYLPERFFKTGKALDINWSFDNVEKIMRNCVGCVIIAFPRWMAEGKCISSEFLHYEGAVANALNIPMLVLSDARIEKRGILSEAGGNYIFPVTEDATVQWLEESTFNTLFSRWIDKISKRFDLFFGYCSEAETTASAIYKYLAGVLQLKILEWKISFRPGSTILQEIQNATEICSGGIFLFTKDDALKGTDKKAAPRDNVILETGVFIQAKGKDKILVIREAGAKMPADLGGDIYLHLKDRKNIGTIETDLRRFVEASL